MDDDTSPTPTAARLVGLRLRQLQRATGLPAVFGGATAPRRSGRELHITHVRGTIGTSLLDLRVGPGRGLGGSVLASGALRTVPDYASTRSITHDFDEIVVAQERLSSIFALPVTVAGVVRAIIYGAVRGPHRIGDAVLERASAFGTALEQELAGVLTRPATPVLPHSRAAVAELVELARTTGDAATRRRLDQLVADLREVVGGAAPTAGQPALAPREVEVLRLVAVGMTNGEVAGELGLSVETVRAYLRSATRRLGVHNRTAAVHAARVLGLL